MNTYTQLTEFTQTLIDLTYEENEETNAESMEQFTNESIESAYSIIHTDEAARIVTDAINEGDWDEFMESPYGTDVMLAVKNEGAGELGARIGCETLGYAQGIEVFTAWTILAAMLVEWKAAELGYMPSNPAK